jgi:uncharacterized phiE125 gp8 family phage protein
VGTYRVYYQARGFRTGKAVTAKVWRPDGQIEITPAFAEMGEGLYQYIYTYPAAGRYLWLLYENGIGTISHVFKFGSGTGPSSPGFDPPGDSMSTTVVSIGEAKQHLRVTSMADDSYIESLILAVQAHAAAFQGRTYLLTTLTQCFDSFPKMMYLYGPPLVNITSIAYLDAAGTSTPLAVTVYRKDATSEPGRITLEYNQSWPETRGVTNSVTVTYTAGYADAAAFKAALPAAYQAVLLGVGHLYQHRSAVTDKEDGVAGLLPMGFYDLLWPQRVMETIPDAEGY